MKFAGQFVAACWVIIFVVWAISALSVKATKQRQPLPGRLVYLILAVVAFLLVNGKIRGVFLARSVLPHTVGVGVLADFIMLAGLIVAIWARVVLGGNWSARVTLKENHELVQRGPYRVVRHPIYSGLLLMILGTAVFGGLGSGFVALLICLCGFWIKLRQEEVLLARHLPGYLEYMTRTKALVPFLW